MVQGLQSVNSGSLYLGWICVAREERRGIMCYCFKMITDNVTYTEADKENKSL